MQVDSWVNRIGLHGLLLLTLLCGVSAASAAEKTEKTFQIVVTDQQGIETELKNGIFYWEEKMSETSFVPHELRSICRRNAVRPR